MYAEANSNRRVKDTLMLKRIVSGGQTGVDRAALDVALELGIPIGGWCPQGRRAEDGAIPPKYGLQETKSKEYPVRTRWNVRDSDGTLILRRGEPDRGTALTIRLAQQYRKPYLDIDFEHEPNGVARVKRWIEENKLRKLNVAGPRQSSCPGIYQAAAEFLKKVFSGRMGRKLKE